MGWAYLSGLCGGVHLWRWWGGEHNRGGLPGRKRGLQRRQEEGSREREDSMEMQVILGEKGIFFIILLKTLFKIKINLL